MLTIQPDAPRHGNTHNYSHSPFSDDSDSSSIRIVSYYERSAVLIYQTAAYFDVNHFKTSVIESLPTEIRLNPQLRKIYEDNFALVEYCTWPTPGSYPGSSFYRPFCGNMTKHDWDSFVDRLSLELGISVCHDTLERSATGDFAILPFVNKSGALQAQGQQTLVRFSFGGAISSTSLSNLNPQSMGACKMLSDTVMIEPTPDAIAAQYAFASDLFSSNYDIPVIPRQQGLPSTITKEIDRIRKLILQHPAEASAVGALVFLIILLFILVIAYRLWQNKLRRVAMRQKQQTQQMPEEQEKRIKEKVDVKKADPYKKENGKNNNNNNDDDDDVHEMEHHDEPAKVNSGNLLDRGELALEEAIRNARANFRNLTDNVSTFLGVARDGDQVVAQHEGDHDDEDDDHDEGRTSNNNNKNSSSQAAKEGVSRSESTSTNSSDKAGEVEKEVHDTKSPPKRDRNDTDIFV